MRKVLILASVAEAMTGLALLSVPSLVGWLLFGAELTGTGALAGRVTGIALISLSAMCWPGPPAAGMLIYSAAITLYFAYVGLAVGSVGIFLWPAAALHLMLTAALARAAIRHSLVKTP
jgi:hypothetical protein